MLNSKSIYALLFTSIFFVGCSSAQKKVTTMAAEIPVKETQTMETFVSELLDKMTLEEKIGQMNLYNGFFDATGPAPLEGDQKYKYDNIKTGKVGGMLNVKGVENVRKYQELAVNNSRLGIPLIFGFDVIHGYRTIFPIPLAEAASWDLEAIKLSALWEVKLPLPG